MSASYLRAGNGNRTRIACLEGRSFAFKLYPHESGR
jgi:hypothetical protein